MTRFLRFSRFAGFAFTLFLFSVASAQVQGSPAAPEQQEGEWIEKFLQMRDPFKKPAMSLRHIVKTPLEYFAVNNFKMIGVLTGPYQTRAILVDPSGKSHFVGLNMKIGLHEGQVVHIGPDRVVVREKIPNILGKIENTDLEIPLVSDSSLKQPKEAAGNSMSGVSASGESQGLTRVQEGQ
jgi:hypothetical protein